DFGEGLLGPLFFGRRQLFQSPAGRQEKRALRADEPDGKRACSGVRLGGAASVHSAPHADELESAMPEGWPGFIFSDGPGPKAACDDAGKERRMRRIPCRGGSSVRGRPAGGNKRIDAAQGAATSGHPSTGKKKAPITTAKRTPATPRASAAAPMPRRPAAWAEPVRAPMKGSPPQWAWPDARRPVLKRGTTCRWLACWLACRRCAPMDCSPGWASISGCRADFTAACTFS